MVSHFSEGLVLIQLELDELNVQLDCWFDYEPACRGAREYGSGLQLEPDYPATLALVHAYLPGSNVDIASVMASSVIEGLETAALDRYGDGFLEDV